MSTKITSHEIANLLREKYSKDKYAFMCEVRSATGFNGKIRSADAVAFDLWPSTGQEVSGFEIKVSRSDFMSELKDPSKSQEIFQYCDRWWLVAPEGIISPESVPVSWGFMEVTTAHKLKITRKAPQLTPQPPTVGFMMSVMRSFSLQVDPQTEINRQVALATEKARKEGKASAEIWNERLVKQAEEKARDAQADQHRAQKELDEVLSIVGCGRYDLHKFPLKRASRLIAGFSEVQDLIAGTQRELERYLKLTKDAGADVISGIEKLRLFVDNAPPQPDRNKEFGDVEPGV
jgi:hypothetical protein